MSDSESLSISHKAAVIRRYMMTRKHTPVGLPRPLVTMLVLTSLFFVVELVIGIAINSLALQSDAFHMASDIIALMFALYCSQKTYQKRDQDSTYGFVRMDVVGGFANSIFLLSTCFFIFLDAIKRFTHLNDSEAQVTDFDMLLTVGGLGLGINLIGLGVFHYYGFAHGGNGHECNHNHGESSASNSVDSDSVVATETQVCIIPEEGDSPQQEGHHHKHCHSKNQDKGHSHNLRGAFLHVLGDALGSVGVIVSGLIMKYWEQLGGDVDSHYRYLADPVSSLLIVIIIVSHTLPLTRECIHILLQNVPSGVDVDLLLSTVKDIKGVQGIHDLHIWQLNHQKQILTCHIECQDQTEFMDISDQMKSYFHRCGIHSSTIQPEFCLSQCNHDSQDSTRCHDVTCGNQDCLDKSCC